MKLRTVAVLAVASFMSCGRAGTSEPPSPASIHAAQGHSVAPPGMLETPAPLTPPGRIPCSSAYRAEAVKRAYNGLLWRDPDLGEPYEQIIATDGPAGWLRTLDAIATSDEFKNNVRAVHSDEEILDQLYAGMLGRGIDPTGHDAYLPLIHSGQVTRAAAAIGFSDEFLQDAYVFDAQLTQDAMKRAYLGILGRAADDAGAMAWGQNIIDHGGAGWMHVLEALTASDEYKTGTKATLDPAGIVTQFYEGLLGPNRPLDSGAQGYIDDVTQNRDADATVCIGTSDELMGKLVPPYNRRTGAVTACGHAVCDAGGPFIATGTTLFWGAWGYKFDRARLEQNLDYIAKSGGIDYLRVLGNVGSDDPSDSWADRPTDPRWADYADVIAGFTDLAYDKYGLRVEWTIFGGIGFTSDASSRQALVDTFAAMSKGREQKLMHFEIANEAWQNGFDGDPGQQELRTLTQRLKSQTSVLVAITSDTPDRMCGDYSGGIADLTTVHFDRTSNLSDGYWRPVRQPWGYPDDYACSMPALASSNEPIGPYSSVAADSDPLHLTMADVVAHVANVGLYVLHTGPGVRGGGAADAAYGRPANFWETTDIATTLAGLKALHTYLPPDLANWTKKNGQWADHPLTSDTTQWVRNYAGVNGNRFVSAPIGINGATASFTAKAPMDVQVLDPLTGTVTATYGLNANDSFSVGGPAAIILGTWR